jgi:hypothetical protein
VVAIVRDGGAPGLAFMPPTGTDWQRASASTTGKADGEICAIATSVTRDGLPQIDLEEAVQGAPDRGAVGAFGWLKPTLADKRLDFAVPQLNGHAYELGGAPMASEALTVSGQKPCVRARDPRRFSGCATAERSSFIPLPFKSLQTCFRDPRRASFR